LISDSPIKPPTTQSRLPDAVFIHLGESPCSHLWLNLSRTAKLFPDIQTHLIIDSKVHKKKIPGNVNVIYWEESDSTKDWEESRDLVFRRGFWKYSINRLFALECFHQILGSIPILHIESDILLLPNFPWERISKLGKCYWQPYNSERDVASLLFSPNLKTTTELKSKLMQFLKLNPRHTDMTILREISKVEGRNIGYFPILCNDIPELFNKNYEFDKDTIVNRNEKYFADGIFDSAALGMWLLGHDPRNTYGKFLLHEDSLIKQGKTPIDPRRVTFQVSDEGNLFANSSEEYSPKVPVWSLHVHSKELRLFDDRWKHTLNKYVSLSKTSPSLITEFRGKAVWSMLRDNIATGTPLRFIGGLPFLHKLRFYAYKTREFLKASYGKRHK